MAPNIMFISSYLHVVTYITFTLLFHTASIILFSHIVTKATGCNFSKVGSFCFRFVYISINYDTRAVNYA